jgi:hypothetical protein
VVRREVRASFSVEVVGVWDWGEGGKSWVRERRG